MRQEIEAAIAEAVAAMRGALRNEYHEAAHTYSVVIERLHVLLKEIA
jgi:hypothetical protein